jgi:NADH-quinone oxidoreductase subunit F
MDYGNVQKAGSRLGTGTMVVLDDQTCPVGMVWNLEHFFAQESCGWCTPCWSGLAWTEKILLAMEQGKGSTRDLDTLAFQTKFLAPGTTISGGTLMNNGARGGNERGDYLYRQSAQAGQP